MYIKMMSMSCGIHEIHGVGDCYPWTAMTVLKAKFKNWQAVIGRDSTDSYWLAHNHKGGRLGSVYPPAMIVFSDHVPQPCNIPNAVDILTEKTEDDAGRVYNCSGEWLCAWINAHPEYGRCVPGDAVPNTNSTSTIRAYIWYLSPEFIGEFWPVTKNDTLNKEIKKALKAKKGAEEEELKKAAEVAA